MKKLALVLFIVLAAAGLWWWESPRLATENLLDAARDGDVAELEQLVDADRFQASLRANMRGAAPSARSPGQPRPAPAPSAADDPLLAGLAGDVELVRLHQAARTEWDIDRRGLSGFRVSRRTGEGRPLPALVFARDGLHWKLVGVERTR